MRGSNEPAEMLSFTRDPVPHHPDPLPPQSRGARGQIQPLVRMGGVPPCGMPDDFGH
jgi:hypothetical protein